MRTCARRNRCHAYAPASRCDPMRASAQGMSDVACVGCIEAMTPSSAKIGMSDSATTCACSIRQR